MIEKLKLLKSFLIHRAGVLLSTTKESEIKEK